MQDPANDLLPPANSPSISSISSSDLDTESTGSFFHDRSTTLGTLMGVSFAAIPSQQHQLQRQNRNRSIHVTATAASVSGAIQNRRRNRKERAHHPTVSTAAASARRKWWRLCGDDDARPTSLGEFLAVERRFGDTTFYDAAAELEGVVVSHQHQQPSNERVLFADGRVLPPAADPDETSSSSTDEVFCRFPVSITGICK